jgi:hypothetical protein
LAGFSDMRPKGCATLVTVGCPLFESNLRDELRFQLPISFTCSDVIPPTHCENMLCCKIEERATGRVTWSQLRERMSLNVRCKRKLRDLEVTSALM